MLTSLCIQRSEFGKMNVHDFFCLLPAGFSTVLGGNK